MSLTPWYKRLKSELVVLSQPLPERTLIFLRKDICPTAPQSLIHSGLCLDETVSRTLEVSCQLTL